MKVYVIEEGGYEERRIISIWSTREKAEQACERMRDESLQNDLDNRARNAEGGWVVYWPLAPAPSVYPEITEYEVDAKA